MSFPRYPAYKPSGVEWLGEVPEHWEALRLRFVVALNPSKQEAKEFGNHEVVSFLPMEAIGEDGSLSLEHEKQVAECLSGYTYFRDGDVCIAKITPCFENGKGAILCNLKGGIGFGTTELIVARPEKEKITKEFLDYLFRSQNFRRLGESEMYGAGGQKRVPDSFVRDFTAALPSIEEQNKVTTFLDRETTKIDALIAEQQHLIELLQEKRQAVISHAVAKGLNPDAPMKDSGVEWLGEVPEHWEVSPLKHHWLVTDCKHVTAEFTQEGYPLASIKEVQGRWVDLENAKRTSEAFFNLLSEGNRSPEPGDLVFTRNATVGEVAEVPDNIESFALGQDVVILKKLRITHSSSYTWNLLRSAAIANQLECAMIGSTFRRINVEQIKSLFIPVPPSREQVTIATHLEAIGAQWIKQEQDAQQCISLLEERRSALISAAVTGQIDVRGLAPGADAA
jgi:type I restriction enzyme S subunit